MGIISGTTGSKYVTPTERHDTEWHQALSALSPTNVLHRVSWET